MLTLKRLAQELMETSQDDFPDETPVKVWDPRTEEFFEVSAVVPETVHPDGPMIEIHIVSEAPDRGWQG